VRLPKREGVTEVTNEVATANRIMLNIFKRKNKNKNIEIIEPDGGHYTCGGTTRTKDNSAEKTIISTEIVNFELEFSLTTYVLDEDERKSGFYGVFDLKCKRTDSGVECHYKQRKRFDPNVTADFVTDFDFLAKLDKIVKDEDFAVLNGYSSHTAGLPEMFGNDLTIDYASGEHIYTHNNQSIDLPIEGLRRVKELFDSALKKAEKQLAQKPIEAEPQAEKEPEDFPSNWRCGECGNINRHSDKICSSCGTPKPDSEPLAQCPCGLEFYGNVPSSCPECHMPNKEFM